MYDRTPPKKIVYRFRRPTSSTFQKELNDSCAIIGSYFIDESVPKKGSFLAILVDKLL